MMRCIQPIFIVLQSSLGFADCVNEGLCLDWKYYIASVIVKQQKKAGALNDQLDFDDLDDEPRVKQLIKQIDEQKRKYKESQEKISQLENEKDQFQQTLEISKSRIRQINNEFIKQGDKLKYSTEMLDKQIMKNNQLNKLNMIKENEYKQLEERFKKQENEYVQLMQSVNTDLIQEWKYDLGRLEDQSNRAHDRFKQMQDFCKLKEDESLRLHDKNMLYTHQPQGDQEEQKSLLQKKQQQLEFQKMEFELEDEYFNLQALWSNSVIVSSKQDLERLPKEQNKIIFEQFLPESADQIIDQVLELRFLCLNIDGFIQKDLLQTLNKIQHIISQLPDVLQGLSFKFKNWKYAEVQNQDVPVYELQLHDIISVNFDLRHLYYNQNDGSEQIIDGELNYLTYSEDWDADFKSEPYSDTCKSVELECLYDEESTNISDNKRWFESDIGTVLFYITPEAIELTQEFAQKINYSTAQLIKVKSTGDSVPEPRASFQLLHYFYIIYPEIILGVCLAVIPLTLIFCMCSVIMTGTFWDIDLNLVTFLQNQTTTNGSNYQGSEEIGQIYSFFDIISYDNITYDNSSQFSDIRNGRCGLAILVIGSYIFFNVAAILIPVKKSTPQKQSDICY
ncbi:hypothetical protein PPERSA_11992 [Pseudocohnilembus persalinus]|uniref:CSC1/OSCA1-like cytosolic domain-containing protein n=1 Tax=Pseudocohnilembus persalinus TaxID=266149 RepID=A0A0V0QKJ2_PSEPJ|nr:hypothetical protein PPERSA_11992 [Pseudocohnilembus persalinus]|eukprot:KRX02652.1 hypothetical protein PPERSA_11992 [Pseudocohnilembus persalinus]